jgi:MFS family permease
VGGRRRLLLRLLWHREISFALPVIATQFHASNGAVSLSVTSSLIGYIIGALGDSQIADKWGRRLSLAVSVSVFSAGTLLAAFATNVPELVIVRFISGLGIGAEIAGPTGSGTSEGHWRP